MYRTKQKLLIFQEVLYMNKYNLEASELMIKNIQHLYMNNKPVTMFDVYRKHYNEFDQAIWVFANKEVLSGTIKKESTIIKKIIV